MAAGAIEVILAYVFWSRSLHPCVAPVSWARTTTITRERMSLFADLTARAPNRARRRGGDAIISLKMTAAKQRLLARRGGASVCRRPAEKGDQLSSMVSICSCYAKTPSLKNSLRFFRSRAIACQACVTKL